jgi:hypothetical protein
MVGLGGGGRFDRPPAAVVQAVDNARVQHRYDDYADDDDYDPGLGVG